jgi:hypothetical protein
MTKATPTLCAGQILTGPLFNEPMRVETVQSNGTASWIVGLVGANSERFRKVTMSADDLLRLTVLDPKHSFNGDGRLLRLGLQAYALGIAYEFDPYFGLSISRVDPLPHQLEAIYDYLLKLARVRFLLADDAGAGRDELVALDHDAGGIRDQQLPEFFIGGIVGAISDGRGLLRLIAEIKIIDPGLALRLAQFLFVQR